MQSTNPSSPCIYLSASTTPNAYSRSSSKPDYYYSAPSSPQRKPKNPIICDDPSSNFEFETSKKFSGHIHYEYERSRDFDEEARQKHRERGDSLPAMAFADELFFNGLVMPLKLPPRLQSDKDSNSFSLKSPVSPSPRTVCKIPFSRKSAWNDDFDPFMVALQKVKEEKRGRNSTHRRSRSYSPFRAMSNSNINVPEEKPVQVSKPSYSGPLEFRGSTYARWVRDQTREEGGLGQRGSKSARVRPVKLEQDGLNKPISAGKDNMVNVKEESKVHKLKGIFFKYASFGGKEKKMSSEVQKSSYFSRLSFKFKGNGNASGKKSMACDRKMAVVEYKPSFVFCLGYGVGTPSKVK